MLTNKHVLMSENIQGLRLCTQQVDIHAKTQAYNGWHFTYDDSQ